MAATRVSEDSLTLQLRRSLLAGRNADGGWGYYAGKSSRLEPTCWALMALGPQTETADVLRHWPSSGGLLLERADGGPNLAFQGVALLALRALRIEHDAGTAALISAIEHAKGVALRPSPTQRQDNALQAWSWIPDTFSWVEPTAWCLLALKKWSRAGGFHPDALRGQVAERMLIDRCCVKRRLELRQFERVRARTEGFRSNHGDRTAGHAGSGDRTGRRTQP